MSQLSAARVSEPAPESGTKPRILIVDDEPSLRDMLRIVLRRDGFDVLLAANGREAIAVLEKERVDLLLSDIRMPDVGGVDVLRAAKALNRDIIAFMMTAFASTDSAVEAMRLGAVDYFTKPFNMDELRLKVRQHLEAIPKICAGSPDGGPIARLSLRERFHWLVAPRSTIIQVSPVHSGLCESPERTLEELFEQMVVVP